MKTVIGIATMQGREKYLEQTIKSLSGQGAIIEVYENHKREIDYTDNAKFEPLHRYKEPIYFLSCDDDIIYPSTYVDDMKRAIDSYGIVTHHGRILSGGIGANYYRGHTVIRCGAANSFLGEVDVAGTGVTGFRTDIFNPINLYKSKLQRMSDLVFSLSVAQNKLSIIALPHPNDYFIIQDVPENQTIFGQYNKKCTVQNFVADEIIRIKKG